MAQHYLSERKAINSKYTKTLPPKNEQGFKEQLDHMKQNLYTQKSEVKLPDKPALVQHIEVPSPKTE